MIRPKPIEPICHFEIVVTAAKCLLRVKPEQTKAKVVVPSLQMKLIQARLKPAKRQT